MFLPAQLLPHPPNMKNAPFMALSLCSAGPTSMAFLTQQNTKNATMCRIFHVCILLPLPQPAEFVPPAATCLLHIPSPPPSSWTPEHNHKVMFWCLSVQPSTFYHPGTKNTTLWLCSSCLGGFPYPNTLSTTHYHPDMKNTTCGHVLHVWGVSPFPRHPLDPYTKKATTGLHPSCLGYSPKNPLTQTWRILHVWIVPI